ncbi:MAG: hypothetical protein K2X35_06770 [Bryobacteraceae bacterium]|nr:hypothetical protein [Bryobacteraceae bacterium]
MRTLVAFLLAATLSLAADISGKWRFTVESELGVSNPEATFKQDGAKLTGDYKGQIGEYKVTGTVQGDTVEFSFKASPTGEEMEVKYSGALDPSGKKMKGKVALGTLGSGTFTAEKL